MHFDSIGFEVRHSPYCTENSSIATLRLQAAKMRFVVMTIDPHIEQHSCCGPNHHTHTHTHFGATSITFLTTDAGTPAPLSIGKEKMPF